MEHIATGSMAKIYRARESGNQGLAKELVIKQLREECAGRPEATRKFLEDVRIATTFEHKHVAHTYEVGEINGQYYIAMELLKGRELVAILRQAAATGHVLPLQISLGIITQVLDGLCYIHARTDPQGKPLKLCHHDINPTTIHVGEDGTCRIVDFGIATARSNINPKEGQVIGSLGYMAPEQLQGQIGNQQADIFAVGVMLYEMSLGRRLFRGPRDAVFHRIMDGNIPVPTFIDPEFPPALEAIIMKSLEVVATDRYQTCEHMLRDINTFIEESGLNVIPRMVGTYVLEIFKEQNSEFGTDEDVYADLVHKSFDLTGFDRFEAKPTPMPPEWAKSVGSVNKNGQVGVKKRSMTIANMDQFVANIHLDSKPHPAANASAISPKKSSGQTSPPGDTHKEVRRQRTPRPLKPTSSDASRSMSSTRNPIVSVDPSMSLSSGTFAHQVMSSQRSKVTSALIWVLIVLSMSGLGWMAYTMFTSK